MDLSPVKLEILEALLLHEKPVKAVEIAGETGKERPAVQMHLIGLVRMGYAESPAKGCYLISENGKKALGLPQVTKDLALKILGQTPHNKTFHFYTDIGKPLNIHAQDLLDFREKIGKINADSIMFHFSRGDFEAWFSSLGDAELAKETGLLKSKRLPVEKLREKIHELVESRCVKLSKAMEQASPPA
ncbi:MAG: DUF5752 family protein [Candidatus Bathyarchaeota archaeon]|nr:DUF5752 family protein [Candidatus Bathyarchaeota archaeon]